MEEKKYYKSLEDNTVKFKTVIPKYSPITYHKGRKYCLEAFTKKCTSM